MPILNFRLSAFCLIILFCSSCKDTVNRNTLFEELTPEITGVNFINKSLEKKDFNIFNYRNFYNGGGVAIGDINGDNLPDLFVTSNFEDNKLYLNKGNFKFEDITQKAGIISKKFWSTGATFADVNGDGAMDIYVCNSGSRDARGNQLYINQNSKNSIPTFKEDAQNYGLSDGGFSTHAAFFDYDKDGDLDMYMLNNSFTPIDKLGYQNLRNQRDALGGDKLYRNDNNKFVDISEKAGIYGSLIGFGLGITIGDVNNDNWPDIYISNDFYERDYLYINQKNGTFKEDIMNQMPHISLSSMGADIADINNDGNLDIFVTDMLPADDVRLKTTSTFEGSDLFDFKVKQDFGYQYMHNALHLNNGDNTFSEISQLAGVHATDWSWGALIFDMDNDGQKDIFVANGILKDLTDQDFVNFMGDRNTMQQMLEGKKFDYKEFTDKISSKPIPNYAFKNKENLKFENKTKDWGLAGPGFSNGAAYGDLDGDGDLDLVVNNLNSPVSIFKNKTNEKENNNFLSVTLKGGAQNLNGIGANVTLYFNKQKRTLQQMPNRGFQSSCDFKMVFGLGKVDKIDSLEVLWPNDKKQILRNIAINKTLNLNIKDASLPFLEKQKKQNILFVDESKLVNAVHLENDFKDWNRDLLLKQKYSTMGPALAIGDVNMDGLDDFYLGGANGIESQLFTQNSNGSFTKKIQPVFLTDINKEAADAVFFDKDGDKDLDLFVVTGSNEYSENGVELLDLLYENDGKGNFSIASNFPSIYENGSTVSVLDFDNDGDKDLFVAGRLVAGKYGLSANSHLFINDGKGNFKNQTKRFFEDGTDFGMISATSFGDFDKDGTLDLITAGDWGGIKIWKNKNRKFEKPIELQNSAGLWNSIKAVDVDLDGDMDIIAGNIGENTKLKTSINKPATMHVADFDNNGAFEQVISCETENGNVYPMLLKPDITRAIPSLKTKFLKYIDYAGKTITEIFSEDMVAKATERKIETTSTKLFLNDGKGNFSEQELPIEVQFSNVAAIETADFDHDGKIDIILTGNFYDTLPEWGRTDASYGVFLKGMGFGKFQFIKNNTIGLKVLGQVRKSGQIKTKAGKSIIFAKNNDKVSMFKNL